MVITEVIYYGFESELLEAHLAEHRPHVDRIIVAECDRTTTGYLKPLFFNDNKSRYDKYDVEHIIIPNSLYKPIVSNNEQTWGTQFRIQDSIKKQYIHPLVCKGADWIFHNDTDEIMKPESWAATLDTMEKHPEWMTAQLFPSLMYCYVNVMAKRRDKTSYRWFRAVEGDHLINVKSKPRGSLLEPGVAGAWHFHNCYSSPEDMYWHGWNRLEWWEGPSNVPDIDFWKSLFRKKDVYKIEDDSVRMQSVKEFMLNDKPEQIAQCQLVNINELPKYIQNNIDKFPIYNT